MLHPHVRAADWTGSWTHRQRESGTYADVTVFNLDGQEDTVSEEELVRVASGSLPTSDRQQSGTRSRPFHKLSQTQLLKTIRAVV